MARQKVSGIYLITCKRQGRLPLYYVGQTVDFARRKKEHLHELRKGNHYNEKLQRCFLKYGDLQIELVEECLDEQLNEFEQWWLDELFGNDRVANTAVEARSNRGYRKTEASRLKQSERQRGSKNHMFGKQMAETVKAKIAAALLGENNHFFGKQHSEKSKQLMRENAAGLRDEVKRKIADALRGKTLPKGAVEKLRWCHPVKRVEGRSVTNGSTVVFDSVGEAFRSGFHKTHIAECCEGKRSTHKGYKWRWLDADKQKTPATCT